jgi:aminopeptidase N
MVNGDRIPMTIIEASNTARTEYNQCVQRQQKLLNDLKVKRSDRLSKQIKENASILNLVQLWKEEDSRKKLIKLGEIRKKALSDEISNLSSMDEVKARILGLSDDEVLNG